MTHGICDNCGSFRLTFGHVDDDGRLRRGCTCEKCGHVEPPEAERWGDAADA